ncbi:hypothetical protein O3G_MSEX008640 [Manduca sexta]|nr:hypothetical protein O3G_MSEX008640 [Manduca sexta]
MLRMCLLLCIVGGVVCQIEQSIFAQLYYPPVVHAQPRPRNTSPQPTIVRRERSAFDKEQDRESNNAILRRLREKMADPKWTPEIRPRKM